MSVGLWKQPELKGDSWNLTQKIGGKDTLELGTRKAEAEVQGGTQR
jgi:hypothetical protein